MAKADFEIKNYLGHKVQDGETLASIAAKNGLTWQALAKFNFKTDEPAKVNDCLYKYVGCRQKTRDGRNYIFTSRDDPGIIAIPTTPPPLTLETGRRHRILLRTPEPLGAVELQTVDDLFHIVGNVALVLKPEAGGPEVELTTDEHGYGRKKGVRAGRYRVMIKDAGPAFFVHGQGLPAGSPVSRSAETYQEAVIDTGASVDVTARVVVTTRTTGEQRAERKLLDQIYARHKNRRDLKGRGQETAAVTANLESYSRRHFRACIDNLAVAAGWIESFERIDIGALVTELLPSYLADHLPSARARGLYVWVLEATGTHPQLCLWNSSGKREKCFRLAAEVVGLVGAYAGLEGAKRSLFVDIGTSTLHLAVKDRQNQTYLVEELVSEEHRSELEAARSAHSGEVPIVYYLPTAKELLDFALHGGAGRLEDYGVDSQVNEHIHERNLRTCRSVSAAYDKYLNDYIAKVVNTLSALELRKLGPPLAAYRLPVPSNATQAQANEILKLVWDTNQKRAWGAVSKQLDKFENRLSEGAPFLRIKVKHELTLPQKRPGEARLGPAMPEVPDAAGRASFANSVEIEGSWTVQLTEQGIRSVRADPDPLLKLSGEFEKGEATYGLELKRKATDPGFCEVTLRTGPLELERNTESNFKASVHALPAVWAHAEANPRSAEFAGGVTIKKEKLLEVLPGLLKGRRNGDRLQRLLEKYDMLLPAEIALQIGVVGIKEDTLLAVISRAPGFFERRDLKELLAGETFWNDLTTDERWHLENLGWEMVSWDLKELKGVAELLPPTLTKTAAEFTPAERISMLHLGFDSVEDYQKRVKEVCGEAESTSDGLSAALKRLAPHS